MDALTPTAGNVTNPTQGTQRRNAVSRLWRRRWFRAALVLLLAAGPLIAWRLSSIEKPPEDPPEAAKILAAQEQTGNFGILIPAYLPKGFDRAGVEIKVSQRASSGEPSVELVYRHRTGARIIINQWVPSNPELQTLQGSRPIETKWGKGWLLTQARSLASLWVDIGPLRVALTTPDLDVVSREQLVQAGNTLGLASNLQVYSFVTALPAIRGIAPPPPFEVKTNSQGIQELNLTITPGGYSPIRFAVKQGIPVKINFRAIGEVGCGNVLIFPADLKNPSALQISDEQPVQVLEFTPQVAGHFGFRCTNNCFRGVMTVRERDR
jgi:hypothetical protein